MALQSHLQRTYNVPPATISIAETYDASINTTAEVTLNAATNYIEVCAFAKPVMLKWGTGDATTADFDEVIPQDTCRAFFIPIDSSTSKKYTALNVIEQAASAAVAISEKTVS